MISDKKIHLIVYTVLHFCVDLSCIYFLAGTAAVAERDYHSWIMLVVLYNFMAFGLPTVVGLIADKWKENEYMAVLGCVFVAAAFVLRGNLVAAVIAAGLGNGMFHIGGGRQILEDSGKKFAPCGIFISAGAVGVTLGTYWGGQHIVLYNMFITLLILGALLILIVRFTERGWGRGDEVTRAGAEISDEPAGGGITDHNEKHSMPAGVMFLCFIALFAVVVIRSCYGSLTVYDWKTGFAMVFGFTLCVAGGKFLGGIIADRIGVIKTSAISLAAAGILAFFSFDNPICGMVSILFFNMTMPLTLSLMYRLFSRLPGFAFGILMLALFLGTIPGTVFKTSAFSSPKGLLVLCAVSLLLLVGASMEMRKQGRKS